MVKFGMKSGSGVYQAIISQMPPHDVYIETHLGTGAIMKAKAPAARNVGLDIDPEVIAGSIDECELIETDAAQYIRNYPAADYLEHRVLIYADPPYLAETRTGEDKYRFEYTDDQHLELLLALRDAADEGALVMISGYWSRLYANTLHDWRLVQFQAMTRGGVRTECLWLSFPAGPVHWHEFAGVNFTDRQRIKRKAARWAKNYADLPDSERQAVLGALLATHG